MRSWGLEIDEPNWGVIRRDLVLSLGAFSFETSRFHLKEIPQLQVEMGQVFSMFARILGPEKRMLEGGSHLSVSRLLLSPPSNCSRCPQVQCQSICFRFFSR